MNTEVIGNRLMVLRGARTQKEVADAVGVSQPTLAMYESGQRVPSDEKKLALANYFGKTVQEIFFD